MPATTVLSLAPHHPFRREGSDDSLHQAPRVHDASRRRGGGMAARGAGAAATKLPTIGYLGATSPSAESQRIAAFLKRLAELGWIEGHTIAIEYRWAEGNSTRAAEFAGEFVRLKVDVILTAGGVLAAVKSVTSVTPIVFAAASDPIGAGFAASLARPGGNLTGLSLQTRSCCQARRNLARA